MAEAPVPGYQSGYRLPTGRSDVSMQLTSAYMGHTDERPSINTSALLETSTGTQQQPPMLMPQSGNANISHGYQNLGYPGASILGPPPLPPLNTDSTPLIGRSAPFENPRVTQQSVMMPQPKNTSPGHMNVGNPGASILGPAPIAAQRLHHEISPGAYQNPEASWMSATAYESQSHHSHAHGSALPRHVMGAQGSNILPSYNTAGIQQQPSRFQAVDDAMQFPNAFESSQLQRTARVVDHTVGSTEKVRYGPSCCICRRQGRIVTHNEGGHHLTVELFLLQCGHSACKRCLNGVRKFNYTSIYYTSQVLSVREHF